MQIDSTTPAIVSGGASGLGAATVRALARHGAPVTILDLDQAKGDALANELGAVFIRTDVTSDDSVSAALTTARERFGQERICVCCAGIAPAAKTAGKRGPHDMATFERTIAINLTGTFRVMAYSAAGMVNAEPVSNTSPERGVIVNTASVAAFEGQVGQVAYAASKGGIAGLILPAARDLAPKNVRVVGIAPGTFDTPMLAGLPDDVRASLAEQVPAPSRLGDPAEFAQLACAIIENPYINGETIRIDGALRMGPT